ncbi:hypothetical protein HY485_05310 [Candidatus Woesearchaeota archaeon]|nr:hypothetical protein [Candidatus Woesearchaeota archaeon]
MSNTKGITEATLALLIIALITMGFLGVFVYNYGERQTCTQKIELCRTSMTILNAFRRISFQAFMSEPKIDCPICVPGSSDKITTEKPEESMHEIAEHLRSCWYKTLGKNNHLAENTFLGFYFRQKLCMVCSEFVTNQDIKPQKFMTYLQTTKIKTGAGAGKTYAEYLHTDLGSAGILSYKLLRPVVGISGLGQALVYKDINAIISPEQNPIAANIPPEVRIPQPITSNKKFQVVYYTWVTPGRSALLFNQIFIVPNDYVPELPCDIYHYQKE